LVALSACGPKETWDYVTLGDSLQAGSMIAEEYAKYMEKDQRVEVMLNQLAESGTPPSYLLTKLQSNPEVREAVTNAEVITFNFSPGWADFPESRYLKGECGGVDNQDCLHEALIKAKADWTAIADEIAALKNGDPVLIRMFSTGTWPYDGFYDDRITAKQKAEMLKYYVEVRDYVEQDAKARGIQIVRIFADPYFDDEPPPSDYFQSDGLHLSEMGSEIVAEMLRELDYEFVVLK
jgi:hypothetical protein